MVHTNGDTEIFMTPDDFLRSITPGIKQPDGSLINSKIYCFLPVKFVILFFNEFNLGLGLDQFKRYDPKVSPAL